MKFVKLLSYSVNIALILILALSSPSYGQQRGIFSTNINFGSFSRSVAFSVPGNYSTSQTYPLIIGMHPAQTPGTAMRDMLQGCANNLNAILACPEGPDGDGAAIMPLVDWCKKNYKIDDKRIILTGYSAGGWPTFQIGLDNTATFKGLIGIAPSVSSYGINMNAVTQIPIAIIVGTSDQMYSGLKSFINDVKARGGITKFVEKSGVGHTGEYFWTGGLTTDWIDCYNFCINTKFPPAQVLLSRPYNGAEKQPIPTTIEWQPIANADYYKIEISTDKGLFKKAQTQETSYTPINMQKNTTYYWMICAVNDGGEGAWSPTWSFTTISDPPQETVSLALPEDNEEVKGDLVTFQWYAVDGAELYHFYLIEEGADTPFYEDSTIETYSDATIQYDVYNIDAGKKYKWRVRGLNSGGYGPWSDWSSFITLPEPPSTKATLLEPADNAIDQPLSIEFQWNIIEGAENYHLQVTKVSDGSIFYDDSTITNPMAGVLVKHNVDGLNYDSDYNWLVRGSNKGGYGPWSSKRRFSTLHDTKVIDSHISNFKMTCLPNPVLNTAAIKFELCEDANVSIKIFNQMGIELAVLNQSSMEAGLHKIEFNSADFYSGLFFISLQADGIVEVMKIAIIK